MENPYTSPQSDPRSMPLDDSSADPAALRLARIGEIGVAWEKLRVCYNIVPAVVALLAVLAVDFSKFADRRRA